MNTSDHEIDPSPLAPSSATANDGPHILLSHAASWRSALSIQGYRSYANSNVFDLLSGTCDLYPTISEAGNQ